jgi:nitroreductase
MLRDLVLKTRSIRRFQEDAAIERETLRELIDLANHSASGGNFQPLKYILSTEAERNALIFPHLAWAGFLEDWPGPAPGERPAAYIIILLDTLIREKAGYDPGIAAQSILLGASEKGLGGCIIGSIQRHKLRRVLAIPAIYEVLLVLALGKPRETVVIEKVGSPHGIKYWRDEQGIHHVPKRAVDDIIVG